MFLWPHVLMGPQLHRLTHRGALAVDVRGCREAMLVEHGEPVAIDRQIGLLRQRAVRCAIKRLRVDGGACDKSELEVGGRLGGFDFTKIKL